MPRIRSLIALAISAIIGILFLLFTFIESELLFEISWIWDDVHKSVWYGWSGDMRVTGLTSVIYDAISRDDSIVSSVLAKLKHPSHYIGEAFLGSHFHPSPNFRLSVHYELYQAGLIIDLIASTLGFLLMVGIVATGNDWAVLPVIKLTLAIFIVLFMLVAHTMYQITGMSALFFPLTTFLLVGAFFILYYLRADPPNHSVDEEDWEIVEMPIRHNYEIYPGTIEMQQILASSPSSIKVQTNISGFRPDMISGHQSDGSLDQISKDNIMGPVGCVHHPMGPQLSLEQASIITYDPTQANRTAPTPPPLYNSISLNSGEPCTPYSYDEKP